MADGSSGDIMPADALVVDPPPVFSSTGQMQGNLTSAQGQQPVKEEDIPPSARTEFQENIRTQQGRSEAEDRYYLQRRQQEAQRLRDIEGQRPKIPTEKLVGPAPDAREYQKDSMAFASSMAMLGALMAKGGRMSGANALAAFGGALKGWQEGNLEAYTNAVDKWKHETERTIENNRQLMQKYQLVLDNYRLNIDQQRANMEEIAIEHHDQMAHNVLTTGNMVAMAQLQDQRWNWTFGPKGLENTYNTMKTRADIQDQKMRETAQQYFPIIGQIDSFVHPDGTPWTEGEKMSTRNLVNHYFPPPRGTYGGAGRPGQSQANQIKDQLWRERGYDPAQEPTIKEVTDKLAERQGTIREQATIGTRAGSLATVVQESKTILPNVYDAAKKSAGRGNAVWSAANARWEVTKGDEDFAYFVQQINSLNHLYGQILSRTGRGTVTDLNLARDSLNPSQPYSAIRGSLKAIVQDIDIAEKAPEQAMRKDRTISDRQKAMRKELGLDSGSPAGGGKGNVSAEPADAGNVPAGVDPVAWQHMTPEERALWTK